MAIVRTRAQWGLLVAFLLLLFILPLFAGTRILSLMNIIGITVISVLGLNILTGYCGQISLGHAAFMAVGAYTSGILSVKLGFPFWIAMPCAGVVAGLVGLIFGLPAVRVKGFYLLLTTLAAQFIIMWIILHRPGLTGGAMGLDVPFPRLGGIVFDSDRSYYYIVIVTAIAMTVMAKNIVRTRVGRAFVAVRDNDLAAEVMGINPFAYKLLAFFIGCFYAGVAGSLWGHYLGHLATEHFTLLDSVWYLGMVIVGGAGSTLGAVLGAVSIRLLRDGVDVLTPLLMRTFPAISGGALAALGLASFAIVIVIFLIFEPRGLAHRWELFKASYRLWPYSY
jgi:branched-chain amino acid transport system permease protein